MPRQSRLKLTNLGAQNNSAAERKVRFWAEAQGPLLLPKVAGWLPGTLVAFVAAGRRNEVVNGHAAFGDHRLFAAIDYSTDTKSLGA